MAQIAMTLSEPEGDFAVSNLSNTDNSVRKYIVFNYSVLAHKLESTHVACDFNFIIENEEVLKVMCSHEHCKSGSFLEMVQQSRDNGTTDQ